MTYKRCTRRTYAAGVVTLCTAGVAGCTTREGQDSEGATTSRMYRFDAARTGAALNVDAPTTPWAEEWRVRSEARFRTSPAIVDGIVYVADDFSLYAIKATDGTELWRHDFQTTTLASPAVIGGSVYVASGKRVFAFDRETGDKEWDYSTDASIFASPAVAEGTLYIGSTDGHLYAIDTESGTETWRFETGGWVWSPAVSDDTVYVGSEDAVLYAVDADAGTKRWSFETGGPITSSPVFDEKAVYVGSEGQSIYKVNAETGTQIWEFGMNESLAGSPAVANETLYFVADSLYAVDTADGSKRWDTDQSYITSPVVVDGGVIVGSFNNRTVDLINQSDGARKTSYDLGSMIVTHPAISEEAIVLPTWDDLYSLHPK